MYLGLRRECVSGEVGGVREKTLVEVVLYDQLPFELEGGDLTIDVDLALVVLI